MPIELPAAIEAALIDGGWTKNDMPPENKFSKEPEEPKEPEIPFEEMTSHEKIMAGLKRLSAKKKRGK